MIEARYITAFSNLKEITFIESGEKQGKKGYWFSKHDYTRTFATEQEIFSQLDRRHEGTLFPFKPKT